MFQSFVVLNCTYLFLRCSFFLCLAAVACCSCCRCFVDRLLFHIFLRLRLFFLCCSSPCSLRVRRLVLVSLGCCTFSVCFATSSTMAKRHNFQNFKQELKKSTTHSIHHSDDDENYVDIHRAPVIFRGIWPSVYASTVHFGNT